MLQSLLPRWRDLLCALLPSRSNSDETLRKWCNDDSPGVWFSSSAWSLAALALLSNKRRGTQEATICLPDYFCNSSLRPLRLIGTKFIFYRILANRMPDFAHLRELAKTNNIHLFILVHYFGIPTPTKEAGEFCRQNDIWLIEDGAHCFRPVKRVGVDGDFLLFSPHKHLAIPNGASLTANQKGISNLRIQTAELQKVQSEIFSRFDRYSSTAGIWFIKKFLQKCGITRRSAIHANFFEDANPKALSSPRASSAALKILQRNLPNISQFQNSKRRNARIWTHIMTLQHNLVPLNSDLNSVPYLIEFETPQETLIQEKYSRLKVLATPVSTWPDLPPEVLSNPRHHETAIKLRRSRLFLLNHHTAKTRQICVHNYARFQTNANQQNLVEFSRPSKKDWDSIYDMIDRSNLMQSWWYGESKKDAEGWNCGHSIFLINNSPIAMVQTLRKPKFGIFTIIRVNRGPVFTRKIDGNTQQKILSKICRHGNLLNRKILFLNPELPASANSYLLMNDLHCRERNGPSYRSSYINLNLSLENLRANLHGKWRNMLNAAERNQLRVDIGDNSEKLEWILEKYREVKVQKNFTGVSESLIRALHKFATPRYKLLILRASHDNNYVAGVCLALHGKTATYLIGWNGDTGRQLKANQLLLWNAVSCLKEMNYTSFDLGGIDEENTPGIADFKLSMNGENYELAGEYVRF